VTLVTSGSFGSLAGETGVTTARRGFASQASIGMKQWGHRVGLAIRCTHLCRHLGH